MSIHEFLLKYAVARYVEPDRFNRLGAIKDMDRLSDMALPKVETSIDKYQEEAADTASIKMPGFKSVARPKGAPGTTTLLKKGQKDDYKMNEKIARIVLDIIEERLDRDYTKTADGRFHQVENS